MHIDRTGHPYLEHRADAYRLTMLVQPLSDGRYEMRQDAVLERVAPTWRDLFEHTARGRLGEEDFLQRHAITSMQWNDQADCAAADELLLGGWQPVPRAEEAQHPLHGFRIPRFECSASREPLGCAVWLFDRTPEGARVLVASSAMALSCLQCWLDERQAGVRLQVQ